MKTKGLLLATVVALTACAQIPNRPQFSFETAGPQNVCATAPSHLLWSRYCDVRRFSAEHLATAQRHARVSSAQDLFVLAAALYAGATFLLNPGGLNEGEVTDLRETAVGIAALQVTRQVYNPVNTRDLNRRAHHAYDCVAETTYLALERQGYVRSSETLNTELRTHARALEGDLETVQLTDELKKKATDTLAAARAEIDRAHAQIRAYYSFPDSVVRARDNIHAAVVDGSVRASLNYATLIQAMSTTVEESMAFLNKPAPPPAEPAPQGAPASGTRGPDDIKRTIAALTVRIADSQRVTPNIATLTANLAQCTAVMTTGLRPSEPDLKDIGAGQPPLGGDPFFSQDRGGSPRPS